MERWKLVLATGAIALGGVALGGWLFGSDPASAQQSGYRVCFIARQETLDTNAQAQIAPRTQNYMITVPAGFEPIGGGGYPGGGVVVFCHR